MLKKQFVFFLISGLIAASLNWGSRFLFSYFIGFEASVVLAYFVGMVSAFILMRIFVFNGSGKPLMPQAKIFVVVNIVALIQTFFVSLLMARWVFPSMGLVAHIEALAHLIGIIVPLGTSYLGHKFFTFR